MAIFNSYVSLPEGSFANHHPLNYCRPWKSPIRISDSLPTPCRIYVNLSENRVHQNTIVCYQLSDPNCHFLGQQRYFYLCLTAQMKNLTKKQPARCLWSTPCQALRGKLPWTKEQRPLWGERKTTVRWRYCWGETYVISMDWFKGKITGNSHISYFMGKSIDYSIPTVWLSVWLSYYNTYGIMIDIQMGYLSNRYRAR